LQQALQNYVRAVVLDPAFTPARARIAMCYSQMIDYSWLPVGVSREEVQRRARATADTALHQDSSSADAWVARGYALEHASDSQQVNEIQAAYTRALALDPRHIEAHNRLGWSLHLVGDDVAASREFRHALELDPGFVAGYRGLGQIAMG